MRTPSSTVARLAIQTWSATSIDAETAAKVSDWGSWCAVMNCTSSETSTSVSIFRPPRASSRQRLPILERAPTARA
jgi:hypothetical protein